MAIVRQEVADQLRNVGLEELVKRAGLPGSAGARAEDLAERVDEAADDAAEVVAPAKKAAKKAVAGEEGAAGRPVAGLAARRPGRGQEGTGEEARRPRRRGQPGTGPGGQEGRGKKSAKKS